MKWFGRALMTLVVVALAAGGILMVQMLRSLPRLDELVPTHDKGFKLATVVDWLRSQIKAPVLTGLPFGHVPTKVLLPVGAKVELVTEGRDALVVWGHI